MGQLHRKKEDHDSDHRGTAFVWEKAAGRKYLVEGEGGGVEVMLIGAPDWEGGDPSMMSSESTVEGQEEHLTKTSEAVRGQRAWGR